MKNKLIAWAVAFGVLLSFAARAAETGTIELAAGTQRQIAVGHGVQRVAIADPNVADVLVIKGGRGGVLLVNTARAWLAPRGARAIYGWIAAQKSSAKPL